MYTIVYAHAETLTLRRVKARRAERSKCKHVCVCVCPLELVDYALLNLQITNHTLQITNCNCKLDT